MTVTATTTRPVALPTARDVLTELLDMTEVVLLSVEASGCFLAPSTPPAGSARMVDLDVHAASDDDAIALAARWGLTAHRPDTRPATTGTRAGEYVHRAWTGTIRTTTGPLSIRVRTCRYLPPPVAALPSSPHC